MGDDREEVVSATHILTQADLHSKSAESCTSAKTLPCLTSCCLSRATDWDGKSGSCGEKATT